eukprot:scaffold212_cov404-Prasinococcus_capsulatus_cf.AAC.25
MDGWTAGGGVHKGSPSTGGSDVRGALAVALRRPFPGGTTPTRNRGAAAAAEVRTCTGGMRARRPQTCGCATGARSCGRRERPSSRTLPDDPIKPRLCVVPCSCSRSSYTPWETGSGSLCVR